MSADWLPTLNASLNTLASVFLLAGYTFIRRKRTSAHRAMMIAAFVTSVLFLVSYLAYHLSGQLVTKFQGQGTVRLVYFTVLISHSIVAPAVPVLAIMTVWRALRERFDLHRRIARWTFPLWLYVSVTGVVVYVMLYHMHVSGVTV